MENGRLMFRSEEEKRENDDEIQHKNKIRIKI